MPLNSHVWLTIFLRTGWPYVKAYHSVVLMELRRLAHAQPDCIWELHLGVLKGVFVVYLNFLQRSLAFVVAYRTAAFWTFLLFNAVAISIVVTPECRWLRSYHQLLLELEVLLTLHKLVVTHQRIHTWLLPGWLGIFIKGRLGERRNLLGRILSPFVQ